MTHKLQEYKQTTYETCLACCLLQAVDRVKPVRITQKLELQCIIHSLKFSKFDFVAGHLDFIEKKFNIRFKRIFDTEIQKINLSLIDNLVKKIPVIYIDSYYLSKHYHYPHFITLIGEKGNNYHIFNTWDGREKVIRKKTLEKSIESLRKCLKFCPQILLLE